MTERRSVLAAFKEQASVKVILMSLKAGGEGLNLQEASHVLVLEPWWNPQVHCSSLVLSSLCTTCLVFNSLRTFHSTTFRFTLLTFRFALLYSSCSLILTSPLFISFALFTSLFSLLFFTLHTDWTFFSPSLCRSVALSSLDSHVLSSLCSHSARRLSCRPSAAPTASARSER
jgi:hypothetical protein